MGEVLSLAPKQKKLSEVRAAIDLLNQELSDFGYSPYTFLRGFTSHSARQCTLPGGYVCKEEEGGYSLNPKWLDPLRRALATLQDVMDLLEESLPPSKARRHFQVDSNQYWIQRLELANEPGKVFNMVAGLHTQVQMAFKHIHCTLLLHQGQAIDENEVDVTSRWDWGSMTSSPRLETMWNSPRNPVGALVTEELRKVLWEAMHAEGEGVDLGDTAVYPVTNTKENRWVMMMWNGEVKRFNQGTRLEHPGWEENPEMKGIKGYLGLWVEGLPLGKDGQVDSPSKETSIKTELNSGWEENLPQEESEDCANPDSQGTSSGYAEDPGAGCNCRHQDAPQRA